MLKLNKCYVMLCYVNCTFAGGDTDQQKKCCLIYLNGIAKKTSSTLSYLYVGERTEKRG